MTQKLTKLVLIETPFSGDVEKNVKYARACMRNSIVEHQEFPFASHLLYTQSGILNDNDPTERELGMLAGLSWGSYAALTVVYQDLGISRGMQFGIDLATKQNRPIEYRALGPMWEVFHEQVVFASRNHPFQQRNVLM